MAQDLLHGAADAKTPARRMAILFPEAFMPPSRSPSYTALLRSLADEAAARNTTTEVVPWTVQNQVAVADSLVRRGFDRALVLGYTAMFATSLYTMFNRGFPFIIFNRRIPGLALPSVVYDVHVAAQRMADRLVSLGHRNICLMGHPHDYMAEVETDLPANRGKVSGWLEYLQQKGLIESCAMPLYLAWEPVLGLFNRTFRTIMDGPDRPTAILFAHSPWAGKFLADPHLSRFRVPQELSLATFESTVGMQRPEGCPPLTNIEINYARTAQCVMETIEKLAKGESNVPTIRVPLDTEVTESLGTAPGASLG
jgi:DNA-binding LacI/PurR family transcriptional regulator